MKNIFVKKFSKVVCIFTVIANQKLVVKNVNFAGKDKRTFPILILEKTIYGTGNSSWNYIGMGAIVYRNVF
tara:strand:- start:195 stop:407 length:213 start_codon:yes stop_codon:yes gene_type:complete